MKKLFLISILIFNVFQANASDVGVGLDLYKKVDSWVYELNKKLLQKELEWSAESINNFCPNGVWCTAYFDKWRDFTITELDNIVNDWDISSISKHLLPEKNTLTTDELKALVDRISTWYSQKNQKVNKKAKEFKVLSSIWLYNDWDIENSGYDIMYDIEQINKVIFAKNIPYNWSELNFLNSDMDDFLANNNTPNYNQNLTNTGPISWNTNTWNTANSTWSTFTNNNSLSFCSNNTKLKLDNAILADIASEIVTGNSSCTTVWSSSNPSKSKKTEPGVFPSASQNNNSSTDLLDTFPCNTFYCIEMSTDIYSQNLLSGWANNSIEWILDKHFAIMDKQSRTSMNQSNMTTEFFSLDLLKNFNLPDMAHLWIIVTSLPPPILNLEAKDRQNPDWTNKWNWSKADFSDDNLYSMIFDWYGLKFNSPNDLSAELTDLQISNCWELTTNECNEKLNLIKNDPYNNPDIVKVLDTSLKNEYFNLFNKDLIKFNSFSSELQERIKSLIAITNTTKKKHCD